MVTAGQALNVPKPAWGLQSGCWISRYPGKHAQDRVLPVPQPQTRSGCVWLASCQSWANSTLYVGLRQLTYAQIDLLQISWRATSVCLWPHHQPASYQSDQISWPPMGQSVGCHFLHPGGCSQELRINAVAETGGTKKACSSPEEAHGDSMHVCPIPIQPEVTE